jgi:hypothetical protein
MVTVSWFRNRRAGRRKAEKRVKVYGTVELLAMFDCSDARGSTLVFVSDYQLPWELHAE